MADSCCIRSRVIAVALVVNSAVAATAVGGLVVATRRAPTCTVLSVDAPDHVQPIAAPLAQPTVQWASGVRAFSSQYSETAWSAQQALGAPDVYPRFGDEQGAWASHQPDAATEYIELDFARAQRTRGLEIYETFNPGAITQVELITEQGTRIVVTRSDLSRTGGAARSTFSTPCTNDRIVAAHITVASGDVAGWNEIDAVGLLACQ